jgi:bisphosphoglycerate-independent phosphoglycerate mutase (AlkP superfamily)
MAGVLDTWHDDEGLIVTTSDHGNLEDMSHGKHTENDVPTVVIGTGHAQRTASLYTLADIAPMVTHFLFGEPATTSEGQRSS